ncbi:MAG: hypothetical protein GY820_02800 [Gammaproteobacteria bacterium]|nr:hypothetical protein [Gammaproteobacteria bacterium]
MSTHDGVEKGAYMFVPSRVGEEAGMSLSAISVNKHGKFKVPVKNTSDQAAIQVDPGSTIGTIGQAEIFSVSQLHAKLLERADVEKCRRN